MRNFWRALFFKTIDAIGRAGRWTVATKMRENRQFSASLETGNKQDIRNMRKTCVNPSRRTSSKSAVLTNVSADRAWQ